MTCRVAQQAVAVQAGLHIQTYSIKSKVDMSVDMMQESDVSRLLLT
jgi:hypothetical protein